MRWSGRTGAILLGLVLMSCTHEEPTSANDAVREAIDDAGVDPSSELSYEHFFIFDNESAAIAAADELETSGFDVSTLPPSDGFDEWSVMATRRESLGTDELDALTEELTELAERHGGRYDGWGTPL